MLWHDRFSIQRSKLGLRHLVASDPTQIQHVRQLVGCEWFCFSGALYFDEIAGSGHDDVHVDVGAGVFFVREVEYTLAVYDPNGYSGNAVDQNPFARVALNGGYSQRQCDVAAGDGCGARAAVSS